MYHVQYIRNHGEHQSGEVCQVEKAEYLSLREAGLVIEIDPNKPIPAVPVPALAPADPQPAGVEPVKPVKTRRHKKVEAT